MRDWVKKLGKIYEKEGVPTEKDSGIVEFLGHITVGDTKVVIFKAAIPEHDTILNRTNCPYNLTSEEVHYLKYIFESKYNQTKEDILDMIYNYGTVSIDD